MRDVKSVNVAQLSDYEDLIDVRSPAEYAVDHIPGAISAPVLDDEQRARIGTLYVQVSPFEARKQGATLVAQNIALHLETLFSDKPKSWRPLVYCWRGGQRSAAMAHVLGQVGWTVGVLQGGYKSYRRHVITELGKLPSGFEYRVVCGPTGSGKSRLLQVLRERGAQVLDLEGLARHRGSLLGNLPRQPQPSQKMFESLLWEAFMHFDAQRPVYVEAESRRIGLLDLPQALLEKMRSAPCILLEAPLAARIRLLTEDYSHFLHDPSQFLSCLELLAPLQGNKVIGQWRDLAQQGKWEALVEQLLACHYDPAYRRSTAGNFPRLKDAMVLRLAGLDDGHLRAAAESLAS